MENWEEMPTSQIESKLIAMKEEYEMVKHNISVLAKRLDTLDKLALRAKEIIRNRKKGY